MTKIAAAAGFSNAKQFGSTFRCVTNDTNGIPAERAKRRGSARPETDAPHAMISRTQRFHR